MKYESHILAFGHGLITKLIECLSNQAQALLFTKCRVTVEHP
ncbi:Uncharacterised protein [Yersinia kristensenii]|nr:Uncharacterised protein [Yersinia kristensenii]